MLCCVSAAAIAEPLSQHNEQHAAQQAAENRLFDAGCIRTTTARTGQYSVQPTGPAYQVTGVTLTVSCVKWQGTQPAPITRTLISWTAPTTREDGSTLALADIRGYQIAHNGTVTMTTATQIVSTDIKYGDSVTLQTVDTIGQLSAQAAVKWL